MKKILPLVGAFALFAWTALGLVAWSQVNDKFDVVIQEQGDGRDDNFALLEDRIGVLSSDLDSLVDSLGGNFELLAGALQSQGDAAGIEAAKTAQRLVALEAALPAAMAARETSGALDRVLQRLDRIAEDFDARVENAVLTQQNLTSVERAPTKIERENEPEVVVEPESVVQADPVEPEVVEALAPPAEKSSFLAFHLPSRDFQFEGRQEFELLQDLSRVGFDAKTTLHDFTGISEKVQGHFFVDLAHAEKGIEGRIEIQSSSLGSGLEGRDEAMLEHLEAEQFEKISFQPTGFRVKNVDAEKQKISGVLLGSMTIRGVSKATEMEVSAHVDASRRLVIEGETSLHLPDFAVPVPNRLGVITMEPDVRVWVRLRARAQAAGASR